VTVVADAGMVSEANQKQIEAAGLSFILGARIPYLPYLVAQWRREHPGEQIPDGQVFTQPWPAGPGGSRRDQVIYYQYKADRARRTLRGIDEQVAKAEQAVGGKTPVKRNRFIQLSGGTRSVNRALEEKARALAGLKGYVTNLRACPDGTPVTPEFVIGAYHQLFQIERSFRMAKSDLQARPIYHRKRDSIEAHLTIVLAALAVSRWIERVTGWSIRKFVKTARRYRTIQIQAGPHVITFRRPATRRPAPGHRSDQLPPLTCALVGRSRELILSWSLEPQQRHRQRAFQPGVEAGGIRFARRRARRDAEAEAETVLAPSYTGGRFTV
jgi:Transposase DDE domain